MVAFDFDEQDWTELFEEFRQLVITSGFSAWDQSMIEALAEDDEILISGRALLLQYGFELTRFLKVRSQDNLSKLQTRMGEMIGTSDGGRVRGAVVRTLAGAELSVLSGEPSDDLIRELSAFLFDVSGEDGGYFDDPEGTIA